MSFNVGDIRTFIMNGQTPNEPVSFVWQWPDNTVNVTSSGTISKRLNMGGNPSDSYLFRHSCTVVDDIGQSAVYNDSFVVNNPPIVVPGSALLTANGGAFSFPTRASVIAYDLESSPLTFAWYANGVFLGSGNNSFNYGNVTGTFAGTAVGQRNVSSSSVDYTVTQNGSLTCLIKDNQGGTTAVEFPLFGHPAQSLSLIANAGSSELSVDSGGTPTVRIGIHEFAQFSVYTPSSNHPLTFRWAYFGSNGWSQTQYSNGTTTAFSDGSYQNVDIKFVNGETPGRKVAECFVRDNQTGQVSTVNLSVVLTSNAAPTVGDITITPTNPHVGDFVQFKVNASDPDADLISYKWTFTNFSPNHIRYGRTFNVDTSTMSAGQRITGFLTVTDILQAPTVVNFQSNALLA